MVEFLGVWVNVVNDFISILILNIIFINEKIIIKNDKYELKLKKFIFYNVKGKNLKIIDGNEFIIINLFLGIGLL